MIGRLAGRLIERRPDRVLVDVGGVGYELQVPFSTYCALPDAERASCVLHVHTRVRDDGIQLFGFASTAERLMFERLIAISGVGPRLALAFLSGIGVTELEDAVRREDRVRLQRIPGVGKKTAERVLLELRDRLGAHGTETALTGGTPGAAASDRGDEREDAISALVNLGYARDVAHRAIDRAREATGPQATLEAVLRAALGRLSE